MLALSKKSNPNKIIKAMRKIDRHGMGLYPQNLLNNSKSIKKKLVDYTVKFS